MVAERERERKRSNEWWILFYFIYFTNLIKYIKKFNFETTPCLRCNILFFLFHFSLTFFLRDFLNLTIHLKNGEDSCNALLLIISGFRFLGFALCFSNLFFSLNYLRIWASTVWFYLNLQFPHAKVTLVRFNLLI